jgi:two-component system, OmpR family, phosphate regulon response regulator PhoB
MSQVLVVEDEPAIAELLALHLRHAGHEVVTVPDAPSARQALAQRLPDVALVDWMMPGESGLQLVQSWRAQERTKNLPIIMLTARADEDDKLQGLERGADDYITKPFSGRELVARIKAVLRRRAPQAADDSVTLGDVMLNPATREVRVGEQLLRMGPTEFKLLHFLMTHPERVHSRSQLLDRVWGDHVFIEERTVDVHVKRLREALAPAQRAGLVETVRGVGYRLARSA